MTKMTKVIALVVGVISLTIFNAAQASAQAGSPCEGNDALQVRYIGPCAVTLPSNQFEFTSTSNQVIQAHWSGAPNYDGEAEVDHITGPDSEGLYHIFFLVRYAPVSKMNLLIYTAEGQQSALVDVLGNQLPPFSDIKPVSLTAQRLSGGRCRIRTSMSFFATQDFQYRIGLKLAGNQPIFNGRTKIRKMTNASQTIALTGTLGSFQHWSFNRSLVLKKRQVKTLGEGHFRLRAFQSVSPMGSNQPSYSTGRTVRFTKSNCVSLTATDL